jgi:predicted outer membrane lipoprotein
LSGGAEDGARAALLGAIGCNAAWGIIDAVFYMMTSAFDRNRRLRLARAIAATPDEAAALAAIRSELDPYLASVTRAEDRERLYRSVHNLLAHGRLPRRTGLLFDDVMGAIEVFCIALAASLPAALLGAIGCNAAWGIIDAVFYMMTSAFDRNRRLRLARAIAAFTTCWPMDGCRGDPACYLTMSWAPSRCSASRSPPRSRRRCRFC